MDAERLENGPLVDQGWHLRLADHDRSSASSFSSAPGLIQVFGIIPGFFGFVFLAAWIWMLVAMVIAVRQALDYSSTLRAVGVCVIGWLAQTAILLLFFVITGGPLARII